MVAIQSRDGRLSSVSRLARGWPDRFRPNVASRGAFAALCGSFADCSFCLAIGLPFAPAKPSFPLRCCYV